MSQSTYQVEQPVDKQILDNEQSLKSLHFDSSGGCFQATI